MRYKVLLCVCCLASTLLIQPALAGSGPLGIDSRMNEDKQGIWQHSKQRALERTWLRRA